MSLLGKVVGFIPNVIDSITSVSKQKHANHAQKMILENEQHDREVNERDRRHERDSIDRQGEREAGLFDKVHEREAGVFDKENERASRLHETELHLGDKQLERGANLADRNSERVNSLVDRSEERKAAQITTLSQSEQIKNTHNKLTKSQEKNKELQGELGFANSALRWFSFERSKKEAEDKFIQKKIDFLSEKELSISSHLSQINSELEKEQSKFDVVHGKYERVKESESRDLAQYDLICVELDKKLEELEDLKTKYKHVMDDKEYQKLYAQQHSEVSRMVDKIEVKEISILGSELDSITLKREVNKYQANIKLLASKNKKYELDKRDVAVEKEAISTVTRAMSVGIAQKSLFSESKIVDDLEFNKPLEHNSTIEGSCSPYEGAVEIKEDAQKQLVR